MESILDAFDREGWLSDPEPWKEMRTELAKKKREQFEKKTVSPTTLATFFAVATALVPAGLVLGKTAFQGALLKVDFKSDFHRPALTAMVLATAPLWVAIARFLWLFLIALFSLRKPQAERSVRFRDLLAAKHWGFLSQNSEVETTTHTYESRDPTSIEFERYYKKVLTAALGSHPKRRFVLVVDNLDRLSTEDSLALWSNLQAFLGPSSAQSLELDDRITLLVPYSPDALRQKWRSPGTRVIARSYFEKAFQVRYEVPPPILADWKLFLRDNLTKACPGIADADVAAVVEVFDAMQRQRNERYVPRQFKLLVNQFAIKWEIWADEVLASHIAFYVMQEMSRSDIEQSLRYGQDVTTKTKDEDGRQFPDDEFVRICGTNLSESVAVLLFNQPRSRAVTLLIEDAVKTAVDAGEENKLRQLRDQHGIAFWTLLSRSVQTGISNADAELVSNWAAATKFLAVEHLRDAEKAEFDRLKAYVRSALTSGTAAKLWSPLSDETIVGLEDLLVFDTSEEMKVVVRDVVRATARSSKDEVRVEDRLALVERIAPQLKAHHEASIEWVANMSADQWCEIGWKRSRLANGDRVVPTAQNKEVIAFLQERATADGTDENPFQFATFDPDALAALKEVRPALDSAAICKTLSATLTANSAKNDAASQEVAEKALCGLHAMKRAGVLSEPGMLTSDAAVLARQQIYFSSHRTERRKANVLASTLDANPSFFSSLPQDLLEEQLAELQRLGTKGDREFSSLLFDSIFDFQIAEMTSRLSGKEVSGLEKDLAAAAADNEQLAMMVDDDFVRENLTWLVDVLSAREIPPGEVLRQLEEDGGGIGLLISTIDITKTSHLDSAEQILDYGSDEAKEKIAHSIQSAVKATSHQTLASDLRKGMVILGFIKRTSDRGFTIELPANVDQAVLASIDELFAIVVFWEI